MANDQQTQIPKAGDRWAWGCDNYPGKNKTGGLQLLEESTANVSLMGWVRVAVQNR